MSRDMPSFGLDLFLDTTHVAAAYGWLLVSCLAEMLCADRWIGGRDHPFSLLKTGETNSFYLQAVKLSSPVQTGRTEARTLMTWRTLRRSRQSRRHW